MTTIISVIYTIHTFFAGKCGRYSICRRQNKLTSAYHISIQVTLKKSKNLAVTFLSCNKMYTTVSIGLKGENMT